MKRITSDKIIIVATCPVCMGETNTNVLDISITGMPVCERCDEVTFLECIYIKDENDAS